MLNLMSQCIYHPKKLGTGIVCLKAELSVKHLSDWKIWSLFSTGQAASHGRLITAPARPAQRTQTHTAKGRVAEQSTLF